MDGNCLSCHGGIRSLKEQGRGLHARTGDKPCASCHPDHAGRDFRLIFWGDEGEKGFDHARAGFILDGKHAETECRSCHVTRFQKDPVAKVMKRKNAAASWLGLQTECKACHDDPHKGSFGAACRDCHGTASWKDVAKTGAFPHDRTRFPLVGKHRSLECAACHDPVKAWGKKPAFERCDSCHGDAHAGKATLAGVRVDCASCHNEQGFTPATFTVAQHKKTKYPLEGKHAAVACRSCHTRSQEPKARAALGSAGVRIRPAFSECRSCHAKAHGNQLDARADKGMCESCHTVNGWSPSTFTREAHADLELDLRGRHAEIECRSCHGPERAGLPPLPGPEITGPAKVDLALETRRCRECHADAHQGRFREQPDLEDCRTCHGTSSFHRVEMDVSLHSRFSFPLEGAHRAVPCILCHKELDHEPAGSTLIASPAGLPALPFDQNRSACVDCHRTPHGTQFVREGKETPCSTCHGLEAWKPASRFDHDRDARFSLAGAHRKVACSRCHPGGKDAEGNPQVLYKPLPGTCESCHGGRIR